MSYHHNMVFLCFFRYKLAVQRIVEARQRIKQAVSFVSGRKWRKNITLGNVSVVGTADANLNVPDPTNPAEMSELPKIFIRQNIACLFRMLPDVLHAISVYSTPLPPPHPSPHRYRSEVRHEL